MIGEIYPVLEIFYKVEGSVYFRICPPYNNTTLLYLENKGHINYNHLGSPAYYDASVFDIVDSGIPPNWSVSRVDNSYFIGSKVWENEAFWKAYFDNEI